MLGAKDPAIKLFGKTILLTSSDEVKVVHGDKGGGIEDSDSPSPSSVDLQDKESDDEPREDKVHSDKRPAATIVKEGSPRFFKELANPTSSAEREVGSAQASHNEEDQSETCSSQDKTTLKKPDKIIPCPRCSSMDTKFCYYNNCNVNQPRHFCKNCQRYWTAGGTMRNVPVGAGRRKNKNSIAHYRHITVSEALQTVRTDSANGIHQPTVQPNGTILTFGSDTPRCEPMTSTVNLTDKTMWNCTQNGFRKPDDQRLSVSCGGEGGDENSNRSSVTASSSTDEGRRVSMQEPIMPNMNGFPLQLPCFSGAPWPYPWNSVQWSTPVPPSFGPSNFPVFFIPAPTYWGCPIPGTWNIPWLSPPLMSPSNGVSGCDPNSPTLGKHSREGDMITPCTGNEDPPKHTHSTGGVWIPKTLRIDDPGEASKSSIWDTLGIKNDNHDSFSGGRLFKAFRSKGDEKNHLDEASQVLHANPAALSRSLNFEESS